MVKKHSRSKTSAKKKRTVRRKHKQNRFSQFLLKIMLFAVLSVFGFVFYCYLTLPNLEVALSKTRQPSTTIIAENGNEIQTFGNSFAEVIYLKDLPAYVPQAVIDVEDRRFYAHFGVDFIGLARAVLTNIFAGRYAQGASTITQQVAKNLFLTPQKHLKRKVQELLLAFWLESKFSKEQILTLYLNRVYLGSGTYGIEAAANKYFAKTSRDLTLKEAAVIAGMLKAPSKYNPINSKKNASERAAVVLSLMEQHQSISKKEKERALAEPLADISAYKVEGAKYFADMVYAEVNSFLGEREADIYVSTTLDQDLQQKAEWILRNIVQENRHKNVTQGAVVILDYQGAIKTLVGGTDYEKSQFNRAYQALRQSGSAFKPFTYITALKHGYRPTDIISDTPIQIGKWKPSNFSKTYQGDVTLTEALSQSLNLATVNLAQQLPAEEIIKTARRMGISSKMLNTPALSLGVNGVKVLDMATAYLSIANGGYAAFPYSITEIYTKDGEQLYQREPAEPIRILEESVVEDITDMLEDVVLHGTGKNASLPVFTAGKTGTSQDFRDAWFVGFTKEYVVAVWLGNDDDSPMKNISGGTLPAQIFKKIMLTTLE